MNLLLEIDSATNQWRSGGAIDHGLVTLWKRDLLHLVVKYVGVRRPDLTGVTAVQLAVKTKADYEAEGDFVSGIAATLDVTNEDHAPAAGAVAIAAVFSGGVDPGPYVFSPVLFDASGNRVHAGDTPLQLRLAQDVHTGDESNVPDNLAPSRRATATIATGEDSVVIPFDNITADSFDVLPYFVGRPSGTIGAEVGTNQVTVYLGGTAIEDTLVGAWLVAKTGV